MVVVTGVIGNPLIHDVGDGDGIRLPVDISDIAFVKAEASDTPSPPKSLSFPFFPSGFRHHLLGLK